MKPLSPDERRMMERHMEQDAREGRDGIAGAETFTVMLATVAISLTVLAMAVIPLARWLYAAF